MSKKYQEKEPTGREYVDKTREFVKTVLLRCDQLPQRWSEILLIPLICIAEKIEDNVILANKVYINTKNLNVEELIKAYKQRIDYLTKAIALFSTYDIRFERLMDRIDIGGYEKTRLKNLLCSIINEEKKNNDDFQKIEIKVISHADEMEYVSLNGSKRMKLKLTPKNKDYWIKTELEALEAIQNRLSRDKKGLTKLQSKIAISEPT